MQTQKITSGLAVTALWEARDGEADTVAGILARFVPQAQQEAGGGPQDGPGAGPGGGQHAGHDDKVVDADFEEVDEKKRGQA